MIVGHLGLAALVRRGLPRASLLWLLPASIAPDLLDVCFAVVGICNPYGLYSHTVPVIALLAAATGGVAYIILARGATRAAALPTAIGCLVVIVLHPALDFLTGQKLLWPAGDLVGLRLYERPLTDFLLESAIVVVSCLVLRRSRAAPSWVTAPAVVLALVVLQGTANFALRGLKPSACTTSVTIPV